MPGILSSIFAADDTLGQSADGGQSYAQSESEQSAEGTLDLNPTVEIHSDMSGTYQGLDGSTGEWSSSTDVVLTVDVEATLGLATDLGQTTLE
jgi:hypothetical protein